MNQRETSFPERAPQEGILKSMKMSVEGEEQRKEKDVTRVQEEEEGEGIGGTIHPQEEVKRTALELPVEPLSILASQSWRSEETEG